MKYEIVECKEKTIVGLAARTSNDDSEMGNIIGGLWNKLYAPANVEKITNRPNTYAIGLYSDYDETGYQVTVGFEVNTPADAKDFVVKTIPAGKYARFQIHGDMVEAVAAAWKDIWETPLERTYTGDYEEYVSMNDIDIYIAIR